jgi:hypothetical protein
MLTTGLVMLARRSASTAAACLRNPRCPTAPTGFLPSAAAMVLTGPPPRCHPPAGAREGRPSLGAAKALRYSCAPQCARTLSAAVCCPVRHCAAVAEMPDCRRNARRVPRRWPRPSLPPDVCSSCSARLCMLSDKSSWLPQGAPVYTCRFGGATT